MKFKDRQVLWKDSVSLKELIYKMIVEQKRKIQPGQDLFDELMKVEEFKSIVLWKKWGKEEVRRLYQEERERLQGEKNGTSRGEP